MVPPESAGENARSRQAGQNKTIVARVSMGPRFPIWTSVTRRSIQPVGGKYNAQPRGPLRASSIVRPTDRNIRGFCRAGLQAGPKESAPEAFEFVFEHRFSLPNASLRYFPLRDRLSDWFNKASVARQRNPICQSNLDVEVCAEVSQ